MFMLKSALSYLITASPMEAMTGVQTTPLPTGSTLVTPTPGKSYSTSFVIRLTFVCFKYTA